MAWLTCLIAGLKPWRRCSIRNHFTWNLWLTEVALGHVFLRMLRVSPVSIILPIFHTHLHLKTAVTRAWGRRLVRIFIKSTEHFGNLGSLDRRIIPLSLGFKFSVYSFECRTSLYKSVCMRKVFQPAKSIKICPHRSYALEQIFFLSLIPRRCTSLAYSTLESHIKSKS